MPLYRSQQSNVYHYCDRCAVRQPLALMRWQNGKLLCFPNKCVDAEIIGSRDLNVARQIATDRKELQADPKLTNPADRRNDLFEVMY